MAAVKQRRRDKTNRKTKERLSKLRQQLALGVPDYVIRDEMRLSRGQYKRLKAHHLADHGRKSSLEYFAGHEASKQVAQREAWEVFQIAKEGIPHPMRGEIQEDGKVGPDWLVKPSAAMALQALRLIQDIDRGVIDVGFRLGALREAPKRVEIDQVTTTRHTIELDDSERRSRIDRLSKVLRESERIIDCEVLTDRMLPSAGELVSIDDQLDTVKEEPIPLDNVILFSDGRE